MKTREGRDAARNWNPVCVWMAGVCLCLPSASPARAASVLTPERFMQIAAQCEADVAPQTLVAIAEVESGLDPLSIHDNTAGRSFKADSAETAAALAGQLIAAGHSVDTGLMQINSANLRHFGATLASAFDPCRSIALGAQILGDDYAGGVGHAAQQASLRNALSSYNTGNTTTGFANGYVHKVEVAARQYVPTIDTDRTDSMVKTAQARAAASPPTRWDVWGGLGVMPGVPSLEAKAVAADPGSEGMAVFPAHAD